MLPKTHTQVLLVTFVLLFVVVPLIDGQAQQLGFHGVIVQLIFSAVLIGGVYAVSEQRRTLVIGVALTVPALLTAWLGRLLDNDVLWVIGQVAFPIALLYLVCILVGRLLAADHVDGEIVRAAISSYIVLGVIWAFIYSLFVHFDPESIRGIPPLDQGRMTAVLYYSFTTLTTLGYGDIAPQAQLARTASVLEAITGQLFLAVTIARLVGLQIASSGRSSS